jgi:AraC-like DNA-binding protein
MTQRLTTAIEHRRRIRQSVQHLQSRLQADPGAWPSLQELAEAACLSPFHFIRLYQHATGETPQATARRLKLQSAREQLAGAPHAGVLDVALAHGYESAQAFSRAYRREFGFTPSERMPSGDAPVHAWVVSLPVLPMQALAMSSPAADAGLAFDELMGHLDVGGVPRHHQDMFGVLTPELAFSHACALDNSLVRNSLRLPTARHGEGLHLCISGQPDAVWRRRREPLVAAARDGERPLLLRYLNDPAYRALPEQRIELYLPLPPGAPAAELSRALA